jgi:hypothetical protein
VALSGGRGPSQSPLRVEGRGNMANCKELTYTNRYLREIKDLKHKVGQLKKELRRERLDKKENKGKLIDIIDQLLKK